jgi:hypothetical protein
MRLNDMIVLNAQHLQRALHSYVAYYNHWRTHRSLEMDAPLTRPVQGGLSWEESTRWLR